ncbi:hypothetical protein BKM20_08170 [Pseudomonas avellanae]|uniref:Uncharacterized protein n=3 Tax=Pseudomonas syringae group TaxID=136849 RepID=A0AAD0E3J5_9PSED|nr:hypothetical protein BKM03_24425 [Pseudomonas avellanae]EGH14274.1 HK97 family phage protein [Pseudomonas amygdali pv. morsprunorum str. M302280]KWS61722.1 hypothetical protein AL055_27580 [Pseudomonas amygdali pv. morsprunorum]SPF20214.1 hypothetical protein PSCFBP3800_04761 [Pseudomonas syringae group genomosp. 3]PHN36110.1 hypothetical protein AO261_01315 [Pseudomonas avellanae]
MVNRSRSVKNKSDGSTFFGKYPSIPALPAHPWLRPSLDVNREVVMADMGAITVRVITTH